jgi:hypothetical protein
MRTRRQLIPVNTGSLDQQGCLLLVDGSLAAVLVRLEQAEHSDPTLAGQWFVEAGFGPCETGQQCLVFATLEDAEHWAVACIIDTKSAQNSTDAGRGRQSSADSSTATASPRTTLRH